MIAERLCRQAAREYVYTVTNHWLVRTDDDRLLKPSECEPSWVAENLRQQAETWLHNLLIGGFGLFPAGLGEMLSDEALDMGDVAVHASMYEVTEDTATLTLYVDGELDNVALRKIAKWLDTAWLADGLRDQMHDEVAVEHDGKHFNFWMVNRSGEWAVNEEW